MLNEFLRIKQIFDELTGGTLCDEGSNRSTVQQQIRTQLHIQTKVKIQLQS